MIDLTQHQDELAVVIAEEQAACRVLDGLIAGLHEKLAYYRSHGVPAADVEIVIRRRTEERDRHALALRVAEAQRTP